MGTATITEWIMGSGPAVEGDPVSLTVDFDPQSIELQYTTSGVTTGVTKTSSGTQNKTPAQQTGQSATLTMTLLFDTSTEDNVSVQTKTDPLVRLTLPQKQSAEGPVRKVVRFQWGSFLFFGCVDQMSQTIDFFSDSGVPLRASIHLTLSQVDRPATPAQSGAPGPGQSFGANAGIGASASIGFSASAGASLGAGASAGFSAGAGLSAGVGTTPLTLSQDNDTIQGITARAGGSVSWKAVAVANDIDNPRLLPPGTILSVRAGFQS
jgi:hypothetical protein